MTEKKDTPLSEKNKAGRYHFGLLRKSEYSVGDIVPLSGVYECLENDELKAFKKGEVFTLPDDRDIPVNEVTWVATGNVIEFIAKNVNVEYDKIETLQLRIADLITAFAGRMLFVYLHVVWFGAWILINKGYFGAERIFDPFPYGLLTMIVSLEAIFLATFIMISQNVQAKRSEIRAELDYQTNLSAEKGVAEILALLKELKDQEDTFEEEEIEAKLNPRKTKQKLRGRLSELRRKRELAREDKGIRDMD